MSSQYRIHFRHSCLFFLAMF